jgi:hypothetical protein
MRLGELLVQKGWATRENVESALEEQRCIRARGDDEWLGQILLRHEHVDPDHLASALAEQPSTWASE